MLWANVQNKHTRTRTRTRTHTHTHTHTLTLNDLLSSVILGMMFFLRDKIEYTPVKP